MRGVIKYLLSIVIIGIMSSCSVGQYSSKGVKSVDFAPDIVKLDLTMNDFEYQGEVKVDVEYRSYFNSIIVYELINGEAYNRRLVRNVRFAGQKGMRLSFPIQMATYKLIEKFPNADYYTPVYSEKQVEKMFMGSRTKESATFKVYKQKK